MSKIGELQAKGVIIPEPSQIKIADDVRVENIESGVILNPGVVIQGENTLFGYGSILGPHGFFYNVCCGRNVKLAQGNYSNCVFLDNVEIRSGAEMRNGTLFLEEAQAAHNVGCKMTILGIRVVLGSLINFCDVFVNGGTDEPYGFTEIGSGAIHYNFTPNGLKFGSLIGSGAYGEMYGLYPKTFVGGQTQIIAPIIIGSKVLIPAGTAARQQIPDGVMAVSPALSPGNKDYYPDMLTSLKAKIYDTALLILHQQALAHYFAVIRQAFAKWNEDNFAEKLYQAAKIAIELNIQERLNWLFFQSEHGQPANLFSKLHKSLRLHEEQLQHASGNKIAFHLTEIQEHQAALQVQDSLQQVLSQSVVATNEENEFLATCHTEWQKIKSSSPSSSSQYMQFITNLPIEIKQQGIQWLSSQINKPFQQLQQTFLVALERSKIKQELDGTVATICPHFETLAELEHEHKLLWNGNWTAQHLGIINHSLDEYSNIKIVAWQLLGQTNSIQISPNILTKIFKFLKKWPHPCVFNWPYLISSFSATMDDNSAQQLLRRSALRFHGTDGLRGPTVIPEQQIDLKQSLLWLQKTRELTPQLLESLVRNSIYAYLMLYPQNSQYQEAVLVGCDPRDINANDPQKRQIFYHAVIRGAMSTGQVVYDAGIIPVPAIPCLLASYGATPSSLHTPNSQSPIPVRIGIYKTASHNPATQDGIKLFLYSEGWTGPQYIKADWKLEASITALMIQEALEGPNLAKQPGVRYYIQPLALHILRQAMQAIKLDFSHVAFIVADLANGAFGLPLYQNIISQILETHHIPHIHFVGNHPDGYNINNNQGQERVGAAHLENVSRIRHEEIMSGSFAGFPALQALFDFGHSHCEMLKQGQSAWAIFTDGDGDRSYVALYDPWNDELHLMDGDLSFYHQINYELASRELGSGQNIACSVESNIPFLCALPKLIAQYYPVQWLTSSQSPSANKIGIKRCAVGDKHILKCQCRGVESSGHLIKPYIILGQTSQKEQVVFAGNGPISALSTISAVVQSWNNLHDESYANQFAKICMPYPAPYNNMLYIYFIKKQFWYPNSPLWQKFYQKLQNIWLEYHTSIDTKDVVYTTNIDEFPEEDDILYISFLANNEPQFAILARPSGTENKFSVKFFGVTQHQRLFEQISNELYLEIALQLKDYSLRICQDEKRILEFLARYPHAIPLSDLLAEFLPKNSSPTQLAQWMTLIEAMSEKCQKLISYNGTMLQISERGLLFWKALKENVR